MSLPCSVLANRACPPSIVSTRLASTHVHPLGFHRNRLIARHFGGWLKCRGTLLPISEPWIPPSTERPIPIFHPSMIAREQNLFKSHRWRGKPTLEVNLYDS
jgi:hypothetical protein